MAPAGDGPGLRPCACNAGTHRGAGVQLAVRVQQARAGRCSSAAAAAGGPAPPLHWLGHLVAPRRPACCRLSQPCPHGPGDATGTLPSWAWAPAQAVTQAAGSGVTRAAGVGWHSRRCQELRGLSRACTGKRGAAPRGGPGGHGDAVGSGPTPLPWLSPPHWGWEPGAQPRPGHWESPALAGDGATWDGGLSKAVCARPLWGSGPHCARCAWLWLISTYQGNERAALPGATELVCPGEVQACASPAPARCRRPVQWG